MLSRPRLLLLILLSDQELALQTTLIPTQKLNEELNNFKRLTLPRNTKGEKLFLMKTIKEIFTNFICFDILLF